MTEPMEQTDGQDPAGVEASVFSVLDRLIPASQQTLACAVSGGGDSMALVRLLHRWTAGRGKAVVALTVDHGLRLEAKAEALQVGQWLAALGIEHQILTLSPDTPESNIQMWAREARYAEMAAFCRARGIGALVLGHTQDDQAETVVMRLLRGSGVDGLAAMAERSERAEGPALLRPLLGATRQALRDYLRHLDQPWLDDPSNDNRAFTRVQVRQLMSDLAGLGGSADRLSETAKRMALAGEALNLWTRRELPRFCQVDQRGFLTLEPEVLRHVPEDIGHRLIAAVFQALNGQAYKPRYDKLTRLYEALVAKDAFAGRTFQGWQLTGTRAGAVLVYRESRAYGAEQALDPAEALVWSGFALRYKGRAGDLTVSALGKDASGLALLKDTQENLPPRVVWESLPTVRQGQEIVAFPSLRMILKKGLEPIECDFCHNLTKICG